MATQGRRHQLPQSDGSNRLWLRYIAWLFFLVVMLVIALRFWTALKMVLLGFLASATMASALHPLAMRIPGPKAVGAIAVVLMVLVLAIVAIGGLGWLLVEVGREEFARWPEIREDLDNLVWRIGDVFGVEISFEQIVSSALQWLTGGGLADLAERAVEVISGVVLAIAFIFIGTLYILASSRRTLLEPAMLIVMGAVIAFIVTAILLPILEMNQLF